MSLIEKLKNYLYDEKQEEFDGSAESLQKGIDEISESKVSDKKEEYEELTDEQREELRNKASVLEKEKREYYTNIKITESYSPASNASYNDPIFKATLNADLNQEKPKDENDVEKVEESEEVTEQKEEVQQSTEELSADTEEAEEQTKTEESADESLPVENSREDERQTQVEASSESKTEVVQQPSEQTEGVVEEVAMPETTSVSSQKEVSEAENQEDITEVTKQKYNRPSWDEYFVNIANEVASRATCDRGRSGCIIVKDNQILVAGYVGSPIGLPHCDDVGHLFKKTLHEDGSTTEHCVRTVHAEQNAICQAARRGIAIEGATLYCRMTPCRTCAMLIINCGIKRVVCERKYQRSQDAEEMFKASNIELTYIYNEYQTYEK